MAPTFTHSSTAACAAVVWMLLSAAGCGADPDVEMDTPSDAPGSPESPPGGVEVRTPEALTGIASGIVDPRGNQTPIACATCHGMREEPHELPKKAEALGGPHADLIFRHGELPCASCHHPERYDQLRLADGTGIAMAEAMQLCAQCHGPQARDYRRGSHGGMRGYWDLTRGSRIRNHCVDCHDSHAPAFPRVQPAPPPRDRFLTIPGDSHE
ncbi:MAG: hypothetical protein ACOCXM_09810 [Myxococcota bacterium]